MSIEKGKRYERKIAKILSEWSGIELVRTPDGAPEDLYADIWPKHTTEHFPLAVECKHVEGWSFDQIIQDVGGFYSWLRQAESQATNAIENLKQWYEPMLVFTKNRFPDMVAIGKTCLDRFEYHEPMTPRTVIRVPAVPQLVLGTWIEANKYYVITPLEEFLNTHTYSGLVEACTFYWVTD
jgi:Holliday junction resolvase